MSVWADVDRYIELIQRLFSAREIPKETKLRQLLLVREVANGADARTVASGSGYTAAKLLTWQSALEDVGLWHWLGKRKGPDADRLALAKSGIAQMLLGLLAEEYFERVSAELLSGKQLQVEDERTDRTDTDYRLLTADGQPLFRLNVKFHGTLFKQAQEYVGLAPEDCFALATYKIHGALQRQIAEGIPYVFLIISVPDVPREWIERQVADEWAWLAAHSGRVVEETIAHLLATQSWVDAVRERVRAAEFRAISARRADRLLRSLLFERVHALRLRAFNRLFRGAEINMHLSLTTEMIAYRDLIELLGSMGSHQLVIRLDRGEL